MNRPAPGTDDAEAPWALVLAGGDGTRLQHVTRRVAGAPVPKQYCRLVGECSLLELTLRRVATAIPPERTLVIVNENHLPIATDQLATLPPGNVIVQPRNCDTGLGILLAVSYLARRVPDARVVVFPSDHWVSDDLRFMAHVRRALTLIRRRREDVTLLGIRPDRPDPGLGYLEPGAPIRDRALAPAFRVARFCEKPDATRAAEVIARGGLWNSFVMAFHVDRVLAILRKCRPADVAAVSEVVDDGDSLRALYEIAAPWSFSQAILARVPERLAVVRVDDVGWSDWGTPEAIVRTLTSQKKPLPWWTRAATAAVA
jgi:mannose-1-phosphate guanylyltransferase